MSLPIHATAGNHAGPKSKRGLEVYLTPPCAVEALVRAEPLPTCCWEPCGSEASAIATVLRAHGRRVVCTDITTDGIDFRDRTKAPRGVRAIVANPPFSLAADFVRHGLLLVPKVVILERIQFLESDGRSDILDEGPLARVRVFADRVPRMHKEGWNGKLSSPAMCLAWFVFKRDHRGEAAIPRIRCRTHDAHRRRAQGAMVSLPAPAAPFNLPDRTVSPTSLPSHCAKRKLRSAKPGGQRRARAARPLYILRLLQHHITTVRSNMGRRCSVWKAP